jgi:Cu-Zn family superoxide dismutase
MNIKLNVILLAATLLIVLFLWIRMADAGAQVQARADLKDSAGKSVGRAALRERGNGVIISINVQRLPQGLHAVHVHSVGKCEGPAFTSAGGHFNPLNKKHGFKNPDGPHAGDLADMVVNQDGTGRYEVFVESITLGAGENSVFDADGSAIIIHATADDNLTDPTGNSGDRIACGMIVRVEG